ncbi:MAG: hypothetical protein ACLP1X_10885 [Polyangiaceae bacterium]
MNQSTSITSVDGGQPEAASVTSVDGNQPEAASITSVDGDASDAAVSSSSLDAKCGPTPTQIVDLTILSAETGASLYGVQLAIDATNVYFGYDSMLMSAPIQGGAIRTLARLASDPDEILVTPSYIVFPDRTGNEFNETLLSVPIGGGSVITLASSSNVFTSVAVDDQNVYFIDGEGTKSVPLAGGEVRLITGDITTSNNVGEGVVIGSKLIVPCCTQSSVGSTEGNILSVPLDGGMWTTLAMSQPNASFPLACGADICWWTGTSPSTGYIARLASGNVTTISAPGFPTGLVFDGSNFFETVCDGCTFSGSLVRIPSSGAPAVTMAQADYVAVNDECVYFSANSGLTSGSGCGIYSVAKSYAAASLKPDMDAEDGFGE